MRRLGIAVVVQNVDRTGGMERQALRLAERLAERGARVWLFTTVDVPGVLPKLPRGVRARERRGRLTIYRVPVCVGWVLDWCTSLYELVIASVLAARGSSVDAIYAVHWTAALHAWPVARFLDCPLYVKFAGGGRYGDFASIETNAARKRALDALANAERLVCISPQIAAEAHAAGFREDRFLRIPNGVDLARFQGARPAPLPGPAGSEHVMFVGALRAEKRLPELVRTFARVARTRPRARLVIVGEGPEEPAIRTAARETGLEERVHLLGKRTDVPELLAGARVFVLPSVSEGLSNALLEALAAGVPVVATDIEGNRAVVAREEEALLVPLGDQVALGQAIAKLLDDRELAERLARAGRARARHYDLGEVASQYEQVFRATARRHPSSLQLAWRYGGAFERGALGLALVTAKFYARTVVTIVVIAFKRALGIKGDILGRRATL